MGAVAATADASLGPAVWAVLAFQWGRGAMVVPTQVGVAGAFAVTASARAKDSCPGRWGKPAVGVLAPQAAGFKLVGDLSVGSAVAVVLRSAVGVVVRLVYDTSSGQGRRKCSCGAIKRNPRTAVRVSDSDSITSICCLDYSMARGQGGNGRRVTAPLGAGVGAAGTGCQCAGAFNGTVGISRGAIGVFGNRSRVCGAVIAIVL